MNDVMDKSMRSVFVGNIPYEVTEDKLKDIFSEVGPVVSFKMVYDRDTGKPKGYGFCEYKDQETALSAMRNLNGYEIAGRTLRVDNACTEKSRMELQSLMQESNVTTESPYGPPVDPQKAPEVISKTVASLPPEQMFQLMQQMKLCIQNNPQEARQMLTQNPQLAYALLQAQVVMRIVDPETAVDMLHRASPQVPPMGVPPQGANMSRPPPSIMPTSGRPEPPPMRDSFERLGGGTNSFNDERRDPRNRDPRGDRAANGGGGGGMFNSRNGPPPSLDSVASSMGGGGPAGGGAQLPPHLAGADPEKAQLIMQVLQLTEEQIKMLPQQQREHIMILKEQINQGQR
eukprot:TRINITY_DN29075_c0_g1_i1.p1 TRINITY_DN29075_c0_g1~~TRINITY_DN29075_c0_g1_i1.p1  ORF type:complete len:344 (-),score=90.38 TRINITY_DN29075_c0_g1_i1:373-1404(-)